MILNRSRSFVFVHIPKTAGTSLTEYLSRFTRLGDAEVGGTSFGEIAQPHYRHRFGLEKHSTAAEIGDYLGDNYASYFRFAVVRNPYARAYSLYRFLARWKEGVHYALVSKMSFCEFLGSNLVQRHSHPLTRPQTAWTHNPKTGQLMLDFIGRFENLNQDLSAITTMIMRAPAQAPPIERHNASTEADEWKKVITDEVRGEVRRIYASDFEQFGYAD